LALDRDEGEYATLAWAWMQGLGIPYRDFLEQKPPLAPCYAAASFSGGYSAAAVRFFALFLAASQRPGSFALTFRNREGLGRGLRLPLRLPQRSPPTRKALAPTPSFSSACP